MRLPLGVVVGFLALVGVGASAAHYLQEPYNPGFIRFPTVVALHVVLGGVYLALAPFQFVNRIRSRHLGYHRWVGRLLVAVGLVAGVTALFMGFVIPLSGWGERVIIGLFGGLFLFALVKGFLHVRTGRVALHREWMIRAFALGLSIATMRLIFVPALMIASTHAQIKALSVASFAAAFILNTTVAELWIRATRRSGDPKAGGVNIGRRIVGTDYSATTRRTTSWETKSGDDRTYWCGERSVIFVDGGTRLIYFEDPDGLQSPPLG